MTDVTEFKVNNRKLYLSPVMDLYNREIVSYEIAERPLPTMIESMLTKAFNRLGPDERPIVHSDQGWQYRMPAFRKRLQDKQAGAEHVAQGQLPRQCGNGKLLWNAEVRALLRQ